MADQARSIVWIDAGGFKAITRINTAAGASSIQTALLAASNADWTEEWEGDLNQNSSPSPIAADYQPTVLRAVFSFLCADNSQVDIILPAPMVGNFLADEQTIDPSSITAAAVITACIGNLISTTGSPAVSYIGGKLMQGSRTPL
jgi:hypothetical protein